MEIALIVFTFLLIIAGSLSVFFPVVPGPIIAWTGPFIYFLATPATNEASLPYINIWTIIFSGILVLISYIFEFVSSYWGAKKMGASWKGALGAFIGGIIAMIILFFTTAGSLSILGLLIGPIIGAFFGEFLSNKSFKESAKAGFGTLLGAFAALALKLFVCMTILVWMLISLSVKLIGHL